MMYKKFTENNNTIFYNILDQLVNNYNNKYHSTIKMSPIEGSKKVNEKKIKKSNINLKINNNFLEVSKTY